MLRHWFLAYTFSSCLPEPDHPVVLACPVVVGAACHPYRRLPVRAARSFAMLLRQHNGAGLSLPRDIKIGPDRPRVVWIPCGSRKSVHLKGFRETLQ